MSKNNKVIIIGGGASGLVAAIFASQNNDVTILEKNSKCGKKILATGNGKCNYFNSDFTSVHFNAENIDKLETIISDSNKLLTTKTDITIEEINELLNPKSEENKTSK